MAPNKINFNDSEFLDKIQEECLRIQDDLSNPEKVRRIVLDIGQNIFLLQCIMRRKDNRKRLWLSTGV